MKEASKKISLKFDNLKEYREVQRPPTPINWVLVEKIHIDVSGDWTCPAKCLVIYGHDEDLDYCAINADKEPNAITVLDDCKTLEELKKRVKANPTLLPNFELEQTISEVAYFKQSKGPVRPILWLRIGNLEIQQLMLTLPFRQCAKYLTVKFISSDNTPALQQGDMSEPNVDCRNILVYGQYLCNI